MNASCAYSNRMSQPLGSVGDVERYSVEELESAIHRHNRLYWEEQAPEISDYDYDRLVVRLQQLAPDSPVLQELGERGERLGEPVQHARPMLSLDKCYSAAELEDWAATIEGDFVAMPKFDGIACSLRYDERGRLKLAATRGTGFVGDDVTVNAHGIRDIPKMLAPNVEVRGEVYMRLSVFAAFRERFSNPRNLTAGAMKQKDAKKSAEYKLSFTAYDLLGTDHATELEKIAWLEAHGFPKLDHQLALRGHLQEAYEAFAEKRPSLDYEIDGVVFRANLVREEKRLGQTAHHPRFALAYKFQGESGRTRLVDVEWSVSRTGAITPVALIEPVQLSGAAVGRASLHHPGYVKKLGLAKGCEVLVTRRGGVIPHVERMLAPGAEPIEPPAKCPSCGSPTRWNGDFLSCSRPETCRLARIGDLEHFCTVTELLGFGERILSAAYDAGILQRPPDLYRVTTDQLAKLERVGEKTAQNLLAQVQSKRRLPLETFLRALGISELGAHVSTLLAEHYGSLEKIRALDVEELAALHSVGEIIARSVVGGLEENAPLIDELLDEGVIVEPPERSRMAGPLAGYSFVFTGKLEAMDRKVAQAEVRQLGGETPSSVSASLCFLVVGEEKGGAKSTKQKSAEKHIQAGASIRVLDEAGFLKLLEAARRGERP